MLALLGLLLDPACLLWWLLLHLTLRLGPLNVLPSLLVFSRVGLVSAGPSDFHAIPLVVDHLDQLL